MHCGGCATSSHGPGTAWATYLADTNTVEFTAGIDQGSGRGGLRRHGRGAHQPRPANPLCPRPTRWPTGCSCNVTWPRPGLPGRATAGTAGAGHSGTGGVDRLRPTAHLPLGVGGGTARGKRRTHGPAQRGAHRQRPVERVYDRRGAHLPTAAASCTSWPRCCTTCA